MNIVEVKKSFEKGLLKKANVVGVMTGYKITKGKRTKELCVVCLVERKVDGFLLGKDDLIPKSLGGVKTDVIEVGKVEALEIDKTKKHRPCPMGTSGGHYKITAGTNGELLRDKASGKLCIGTNNHVAANSNDAKLGDPYLQPGPYDGGSLSDKIGSLLRFVPITFRTSPPNGGGCSVAKVTTTIYSFPFNFVARLLRRRTRLVPMVIVGEENLVDAAIVEVLQKDVLSEIVGIGKPKGVGEALLGMEVQKSGRTTCHTVGGIVTGIDATISVSYGGGKIADFKDQIIIEKTGFCAGGDSGSLILDMKGNAVGKLFAGSTTITVANHIGHYLGLLNAELILG